MASNVLKRRLPQGDFCCASRRQAGNLFFIALISVSLLSGLPSSAGCVPTE
jgi:hypothetical protein